ncbi:MAG: type II secretion system secretin GspD [Pseudomonadota bacterium]
MTDTPALTSATKALRLPPLQLSSVMARALLCCALLLAAALPGSAFAQQQTWKINIKNADIQEFVAQVAEITGKTFIIDPRLKGNVTVMSNTSMDRDAVYALFLSVLRVHNFTATSSGTGEVVRIQQNAMGKQTPGARGDLSEVAPEELVTRVVAAQNVDSAELMKILRPLIPQYGHIAAVAQPNIVIISDHADNIIRLMRIIRQIDVADEDDMIVVPMKEAWVGTVVALLERVAPDQIGRSAKGPQKIQLIANERNNTLIVKGKSRPVAEVLKLIEKLDQPATAAGSTQVLPLNHAQASDVATILNGLTEGNAQEEGAQQTSIQADESLNAIVVKADPGRIAEIRDLVAALDVRRSQVLIEAAIVEVSLTDTSNLGVELAAADGSGSSVPLVSTSLDGTIGTLLGGILPEDGTEINVLDGLAGVAGVGSPTLAAAKIDVDGVSFGAVINALATNTDANLLSTPSILTLDNQEAKIVVANEVPFRTGSFTTQADGANNPFTTIQREDVGLQLTVTPHVHDGEAVRLEVSQEVSNVVDSGITIGSSGFSDVVTSKRTIDTTILADDKQTIVLGGLIQDDISDSVRKVPLLGDIPVLGNLFRSRNQSRTKRNLLVFLRPTVIRNKDDANNVTARKYSDIWEVEIQSRGSSGYENLDAVVEGRRAEPE